MQQEIKVTQEVYEKDIDAIWKLIKNSSPTERAEIISKLDEKVITALRKYKNPFKVPVIKGSTKKLLKFNVINIREKYMRRFAVTSLIAFVMRMLDEYMPDKSENMVSENSPEFAKIMNDKIKAIQQSGPREKYSALISEVNSQIEAFKAFKANTSKDELTQLVKKSFELNTKLTKYEIYVAQQAHSATEIKHVEVGQILKATQTAIEAQEAYIADLIKIRAKREILGENPIPTQAAELGLNHEQTIRTLVSYDNELKAKNEVLEKTKLQCSEAEASHMEISKLLEEQFKTFNAWKEELNKIEEQGKKVLSKNFNTKNIDFEKYDISDEEYERFVDETKKELNVSQTAEEYADEYRSQVKEFFMYYFKYNPDNHVQAAYKPNYADPSRKPLSEEELNNERMETEREHALSLLPPSDTFYRFDRYITEHYEELRQATDDIYCEKSDLEFTIAPLAVFEGEDAESKSKEFNRKYADEFEADVLTATFGQHNLLAPWEQNREVRDIYTEKTEIVKRIVEQNEEDSKIGMRMTKKRAAKERAKTEKKTGPYAKGLEMHSSGATKQLRKHGVKDIKEIRDGKLTAQSIPEDRTDATMKEVEVGVTVIKPVVRHSKKASSKRITGTTDQWHFNIPAKALEEGQLDVKSASEVKKDLAKKEAREELLED